MRDLRPATLDDAPAVADLETARMPDDPRAAPMVGYEWTHMPEGARSERLLNEQAYLEAYHDPWKESERRYGWIEVTIRPDAWTATLYRGGVERCESWLRDEQADVAVAEVREDFGRELAVLDDLGYREERKVQDWELDLVARRDELLAAARKSRDGMQRQGIELTTVDKTPSLLEQVYELDIATSRDVPTTVPFYVPSFDEWRRNYFENPGIRADRFWIACLGDEVVGMSLIIRPSAECRRPNSRGPLRTIAGAESRAR